MDEPTFFRGRYRIQSSRMPNWDYGNGCYFITICTMGKYPWFGNVQNGFMCLSDAGSIVADEWTKTPLIRPYVELDSWIVMPDHMHGIVMLGGYGAGFENGKLFENVHETPHRGVSTTQTMTMDGKRCWQPGALGPIMNQFKMMCTKRIRADGHSNFAWQPRYHDRAIRNEQSLIDVRRYIMNNPSAWHTDHRLIKPH